MKRIGAVSITLVTDDFHAPIAGLRSILEFVRPLKSNYVRQSSIAFRHSKHHRYEIRRSMRHVTVAEFDLAYHLREWCELYGELVKRHSLSGVHMFSEDYFAELAKMQGIVAIGAWQQNELVSAHLWVDDGCYVQSHLAASSDEGYKISAAYAVYEASIANFLSKPDARVLSFGGGAGSVDNPTDGLVTFKKGFSNDIAQTYLCGLILDQERYRSLSEVSTDPGGAAYFPAYRAPRA